MVWSVRNVVYSGVLERLAKRGIDVHLLMPHDPPPIDQSDYSDFSWASAYHPIFTPEITQAVRGKSFLDAVIYSAYNRRNNIISYPLYRQWEERNFTPMEQLRSQITEILGIASQPRPIYNLLCSYEDWGYHKGHNLEPIYAQLRELKPDAIWSTVCVSSLEYPYALAAQALKIPIITSILSFDNLTSRSVLPPYDHYMVWNESMRDQLLQFYEGVAPNQVTMTGTPQFDFHRNRDFIWSRQKTLDRLGLASTARYFLYAASHEELTPEEPALVAQMVTKMAQDDTLKDYWLIIRLHPLDDWGRWDVVFKETDNVLYSNAWDTQPDKEGWTFSSPTDQSRLISSLAHAEACLNIASTASLDAAAVDCPVIGIEFTDEPDSPRDMLYHEYDTTHYKPLVDSGGLRLAHNWAELANLMKTAVTDRGKDQEKRMTMMTQECGPQDGQAGERVVNTIIEFLEKQQGNQDA
ncbi:MAG: hypothetical protein AAF485_11370 [Chloroflexota bacterium]